MKCWWSERVARTKTLSRSLARPRYGAIEQACHCCLIKNRSFLAKQKNRRRNPVIAVLHCEAFILTASCLLASHGISTFFMTNNKLWTRDEKNNDIFITRNSLKWFQIEKKRKPCNAFDRPDKTQIHISNASVACETVSVFFTSFRSNKREKEWKK